MSTHNPDEYLPVEVAGTIAGITPRTLRHWIKGGKLPAIAGQRGKLVRIGDVVELADLTGRAATPSRQVAGNAGTPATSADVSAGNIAGNTSDESSELAVSPAALSQLETIRDEWLQPLLDRIGTLEHTLGRTEAQRDQAMCQRDQLAERIATDRALTDQLVVALEAERDILRVELEQLRTAFDLDKYRETLHQVETAPEPQEASPTVPGREETAKRYQATLHEPSMVTATWRRLRRRA